MRKVLLSIIFLSSLNSVVTAQSNPDPFTSVKDLENIFHLNTNELSRYLIKAGFKNEGDKHFIASFLRERNGEGIQISKRKESVESLNFTLSGFVTTSKQRFMKIKNSLSAAGYTYYETKGERTTYEKKSSPTYQTINFAVYYDNYKIIFCVQDK